MNLEEKTFAAHLLDFLAYGEKIATRCAKQQAQLTEDRKMRCFFATQARQEKQHAFVFTSATRWFRPKGFQYPKHRGLIDFEKKLDTTLNKGRLAESIMAQQLLFEGLGEITLEKVSQGIEDRGFGFQRVRKTILKQEHAHHQFGEKQINQLFSSAELDTYLLAKQCREYLEILEQTLYDMQSVLQFYNQSAESFYQQLITELPSQLQAEL